MRKFVHSVQAFLEDMKDSHIPAYSAQTAYFIIMSVFPFVLILLSLIRFTALTEDMLMEMISDFLPAIFYPILNGIVEELYERANAVLSISVVLALWSSAKCVLAVTNGFNTIYELIVDTKAERISQFLKNWPKNLVTINKKVKDLDPQVRKCVLQAFNEFFKLYIKRN